MTPLELREKLLDAKSQHRQGLIDVDTLYAAADEYIESLKAGRAPAPPLILIEVYLADDPALTKLKGNNNTLGLDLPGVST